MTPGLEREIVDKDAYEREAQASWVMHYALETGGLDSKKSKKISLQRVRSNLKKKGHDFIRLTAVEMAPIIARWGEGGEFDVTFYVIGAGGCRVYGDTTTIQVSDNSFANFASNPTINEEVYVPALMIFGTFRLFLK